MAKVVSLESLAQDNASLRDDVRTLTNHMITLASQVYKHDEGMGMPEEEMPYDDGMGGGMPMEDPLMDPMAPGGEGAAPGGAPALDGMGGGMPEQVYPDEDKMGGRHGYARSQPREKGYAGNHETASNEEGGKWDTQDDSVKGNEVSPAGAQGGDRGDETFGVGKQLLKRLEDLEANAGITIAKAQIPGNQVDKAQIMGDAASTITREMQMQAVKMPWKDINRYAVDTGYLSANPLG